MTSGSQLLLFEAPTSGTTYKAGDWVKLRKKPQAFGLKRGDVVLIERVHPVLGSLRFWNTLSDRWDFLYPDEVRLTLALVDSVAEPIARVGVDTESNPPDDSVSESIAPAEVDTESIPPDDSVSTSCKAISTYRPRGTARGGEYFRFSYRDGSKMRHIHIKGGNTDSPIAQTKVAEARSLLAIGVKPMEIVKMLRGVA